MVARGAWETQVLYAVVQPFGFITKKWNITFLNEIAKWVCPETANWIANNAFDQLYFTIYRRRVVDMQGKNFAKRQSRAIGSFLKRHKIAFFDPPQPP